MEPSTGERAMKQYCSVCKAHLEMVVVSDASEDGVIWLKCPRCKGILPHMAESTAAGSQPSPSAPDLLQDIDTSQAKPYQPNVVYEVGDVIHHRGWDDFGVVREKMSLPGNRRAILVQFAEHGELRLIEGAS
jgi:hypothetical protein